MVEVSTTFAGDLWIIFKTVQIAEKGRHIQLLKLEGTLNVSGTDIENTFAAVNDLDVDDPNMDWLIQLTTSIIIQQTKS